MCVSMSHTRVTRTEKRGQVNGAHCIIKALNTIDEDVNLIVEQNDVAGYENMMSNTMS